MNRRRAVQVVSSADNVVAIPTATVRTTLRHLMTVVHLLGTTSASSAPGLNVNARLLSVDQRQTSFRQSGNSDRNLSSGNQVPPRQCPSSAKGRYTLPVHTGVFFCARTYPYVRAVLTARTYGWCVRDARLCRPYA